MPGVLAKQHSKNQTVCSHHTEASERVYTPGGEAACNAGKSKEASTEPRVRRWLAWERPLIRVRDESCPQPDGTRNREGTRNLEVNRTQDHVNRARIHERDNRQTGYVYRIIRQAWASASEAEPVAN
jgi:hypothetical protein